MLEWMNDGSFAPSLLLVGGLILILGELLITGTFVLFWFGLSLLMVGAYSLYQPLNWTWQLLLITGVGTLLTAFFNPYLRKTRKPQETQAFAPAAEQTIGTLHLDRKGQCSVFYRGTYWLIDPLTPPNPVQQNLAVKITAVKGNVVSIAMLPEASNTQ
ncbi:MAG: NfeD family protein [Thiotrichales bacterium]|nr:NfeD family protein [Thiotrichales bacterium]